MKKETRRLSTGQKRKLAWELTMLAVATFGIIILICNFFKIVPESNIFITTIVAYGLLIGPGLFVLGIGSFLEIRKINVRKFSPKVR